MKRDMDLFRQLMLDMEDQLPGPGGKTLKPTTVEDESLEANELLWQMKEKGLIDAYEVNNSNDFTISYVRPTRLTADGHDFLDTVRDDGVWSKTKIAISKVGGTATLETWKAVSSEVGKKAALAAASAAGLG